MHNLTPGNAPHHHAISFVASLRQVQAGKLLDTLPHALQALLDVLHTGETLHLTLRHDLHHRVLPVLACTIDAPEASSARQRALRQELRQLLRLHISHQWLQKQHDEADQDNDGPKERIFIRPARRTNWMIRGLAAPGPHPLEETPHVGQRLADTALHGATLSMPAHMMLALRHLERNHRQTDINFTLRRRALSALELRELTDWLTTWEADMQANPLAMSDTQRQMAAIARRMVETGEGYQIACSLCTDGPVSQVALDHISRAIYGTPHAASDASSNEGGNSDATDNALPAWPAEVMLLHGLLPLSTAVAVWANHAVRPLPPTPDAIELAQNLDEQPLHLSLRDRKRHTYINGITGTGKSTLMLNMALQDMEAGRCVILYDPHGDLWEQMRRIIPAHRRDDVQLCHLSDPRWAFTVNMLAWGRGVDTSVVVNALYDLFRRVVYKDIPEAFGPIFESLFRNALTLLLKANHPDLTLADLPRVFTDKKLRNWLLERVQDDEQRHFWQKLFPRLRGDWDEANLTFYVTSKFDLVLRNPLLRRVLAVKGSPLSFQEVLRERRICLINLAKGDVGMRNASFMAGLLSMRLAMAAMQQNRQPAEERHGACVYMDEFHNYASHILADMLAETRKYGLHLTLAHQTLAQLDGSRAIDDLRQDVLANTANKLIFRLGHQDAQILEHFIAPHFSARDLSALDDYHMVALTLDNGKARPPQLVQTPQPPTLQEVQDPPLPQLEDAPLPQHADDSPPPASGGAANDDDDGDDFDFRKWLED